MEIARDTLERLTDPEILASTVEQLRGSSGYPFEMVWRPDGTTSGPAGIAIACAAAQRAWGKGWLQPGHDLLTVAAREGRQAQRMHLGIGHGLAGLGVASELLRSGGPSYRRFQERVDEELAGRVGHMVISPEQYDLLGGCTGIAAYLTMRPRSESTIAALRVIALDLMRRFESPRSVVETFLTYPWSEPVDRVESANARFIDCGLAHGIVGPLALLALMMRDGSSVVDPDEARRRLEVGVEWLLQHIARPSGQYRLPRVVQVDQELVLTPHAASRSGWCYGAAGCARALFLCAGALRSDALAGTALDMLVRAVDDRTNGLVSPTICHGLSGLLLSLAATARDTRDDAAVHAVRQLTARVLDLASPSHALLFRDTENRGATVDNPGLLCGAAGVALTLLTVATGWTRWLRLLLVD
ncbi:MAG: lanthionine synthetase LanC family protein [Frankiaceae bacterium]